AGTLPQEAGLSSSGVTPAASPGVAPPTSTGIAQDVLHHVAANTGSGTFIEGTFEVAYDKLAPAQLLTKRAPQAKPPDECVDFAHTNRDPVRVSEEENRVIKIPRKAPRCHLFPGTA
ncbi:unnamed protein product, partial [Laminaria digitata]